MPRPLDAGVVGRAEPRVGAELHHLRPRRPRQRRAVVREPVSTTISCGGSGSRRERVQQRRQRPGRVVQHDDDRERHAPAAASASTARVRRAVSAQLSGAIASRPAASSRSRSAGSAATRSSASARPAASPGVHVERAVAEHLAQHGEVADDRGRAGGDALDRRQAEALEPRREHDGERARVERAEVLDVPEPAHPGRLDVDAAVARHDQLRLEPALARDPEARHEHVRRLARLERADREEVGVRGGRGRRSASRRGASGTVRTRSGSRPHSRISSPRTASVSHSTRAARRASRARAGRRVPEPLVAREVLRAHLPRAVVDGEHERGRRADRQRRRARAPTRRRSRRAARRAAGGRASAAAPNSTRAGSACRTASTPAGTVASPLGSSTRYSSSGYAEARASSRAAV